MASTSRGALLLSFLLAAPSVARAAVLCVDSHARHGCFASINGAIAAAHAGDTVEVRAGHYVENVVVDKAIALRGGADDSHPGDDRDAGEGAVIYPAVSGPTCATPSSLCPEASVVIAVRSDDVTISALTIDGDNPRLRSGQVRGGADIDARIGIVTDHRTGAYDNLTVEQVTVRNVYARGIYMSTQGRFAFRYNHVRNVQGEAIAVAMLNFGGTGVMEHNLVEQAVDALAANHSRGTRFADNVVERAASGIHTDNAGDLGGDADRIEGNRVSACLEGGNAIWSFSSYLPPSFTGNAVSGCPIAAAVYGVAPGVPEGPTFASNRLRGDGKPGSAGMLVTTADIGFGNLDASATLRNNRIERFEAGVLVHQDGGFHARVDLDGDSLSRSGSGLATDGGSAAAAGVCLDENDTGVVAVGGGAATVHGSELHHSRRLGADARGGSIDARRSYWGARSGPAPSGKGDAIAGPVDYLPFLLAPPDGLRCPAGGGELD